MRADLAPRILALPADIRAALARVEGPGTLVYARQGGVGDIRPMGRIPPHLPDRLAAAAWWPANPAAAVAAVTGWALSACYAVIMTRLQGGFDDDHAAALAIIEAHASRSTP